MIQVIGRSLKEEYCVESVLQLKKCSAKNPTIKTGKRNGCNGGRYNRESEVKAKCIQGPLVAICSTVYNSNPAPC